MNESLKLPSTWAFAPLSDAADVNPRSFCTVPSAVDKPVHFVPMSAVTEEFGGIDVSARRPLGDVQKGYTSFLANDVLLAKITPCMENGKLAVVPPLQDHLAFGSTEFHVLRAKDQVQPSWLAHFLSQSAFRRLARQNMTGSAGQLRVATTWLADALIPVAPAAEQTRIVAKLEELLSDLDAGVAELKAAQKKLAQYRQSLLKAAVEGALTAEWRTQHQPLETGAQLLERILQERRARWETRQLAKFAEQGKTAPKDWQKKYPEPVQPDTTDLPELPQGWVWASLDALIDDGPQNGLYLPASQYGKGTPILRIDDYQIGWHRPRAALNLVDADEINAKVYALNTGDIVINRVNSMTHLGKSLNVSQTLDGALFESNMMRLRLSERMNVNYVSFYLGSHAGRSRLICDAKWAVNQASINQQDVKKTPVPVSSHAEQERISEVLLRQHEAIDLQAKAIEVSLQQSTAQRQNILRAAFSGQLVPQDPNDEPASVLLERIRAERAARDAVKKPRGRKAKEAA